MSKVKGDLGELMYNLMKIKDYYQTELNEENTTLNEYINDLEMKKSKKVKMIIKDIEKKVKSYWKTLILDAVNQLLETINNRKTKGSEFTKITRDLQRTKKELPYDNLDITTLKSYYEDNLRTYREQIKEKIDIERHNRQKYLEGFVVGFILGVIGSIIAPFFDFA